MLIDVIQGRAFPSVHHVPEQAQPFQGGDTGLYQAVINGGCKVQCAFQHKAVCLYRHEQIIERTDCGDNPVAAHCAGQVEQYNIIGCIRFFFKCPSVCHATSRSASDDRISLFLQPSGLLHQEVLINGCGLYHFHIPFFLFHNRMLRIVTIHHRYVQSFHVMQS